MLLISSTGGILQWNKNEQIERWLQLMIASSPFDTAVGYLPNTSLIVVSHSAQ
jgi:hypothetical protein